MEQSQTARRQFRVLHRELLFRVVDRELLSSHAAGDSSRLLLQVVSLLIFIGILCALPAWGFGDVQPPQARHLYAWTLEHAIIATTMLVVGLCAVLIWDGLYPDRRDVLVLAPLPIRTRTIFLAKIAAITSALALAVGALQLVAGVVWPIRLGMAAPGFTMLALTSDPAIPPVGLDDLKSTLDRDITPALSPHSALVIGVSRHGQRRILTYGTASPDSMFEIGSITKTFTATLLAHLVAQGTVRLDEPVRDLLPVSSIGPPRAGIEEITLRDLATHHSSLPVREPYYRSGDPVNPDAGYDAGRLYWYLTQRGLQRQPSRPPFVYSNLGFGLLGDALAKGTFTPYATLIRRIITAPLHLDDTTLALSADQRRRFVQGYDPMQRPMPIFEVGVLASAGALISTAGDMLTWLEANLAAERTHAGPLASDLAATHAIQADAGAEGQIGLAWFFKPAEGIYAHDGATLGQTADAFFDPAHDTAAIVLSNTRGITALAATVVGDHLRARLAGRPAIAIADVTIPASGGLPGMARLFAAWWITMAAAGAFVFGAVLCLQGLAVQVLPRRLFLRVSSLLQLGTFALIVGVYWSQAFALPVRSLVRAQQGGPLAFLPSYWFLALFQSLSGSPALAPLAPRAWLGLTLVAVGASAMYALSYVRTVRRIVEEADIVPASSGVRWLPPFGSPLSTAVVHFSLRTLLRSPQHRVILAFYWGLGLALALFFLQTPPLVSLFMMGLAVLGARIVCALPRDLRSNWIFRVTPMPGGPRFLAARRRALVALGVLPVWIVSATLFPTIWPWPQAAGHLIVLALFGLLLVEISLQQGARKIPFTCAYLPGRSVLHATLWVGLLVLMPLTIKAATLEEAALEDLTSTAIMLTLLGGLYAGARWIARRRARTDDLAPQFEEDPPDQAVALDLWDNASAADHRAARRLIASPSRATSDRSL